MFTHLPPSGTLQIFTASALVTHKLYSGLLHFLGKPLGKWMITGNKRDFETAHILSLLSNAIVCMHDAVF